MPECRRIQYLENIHSKLPRAIDLMTEGIIKKEVTIDERMACELCQSWLAYGVHVKCTLVDTGLSWEVQHGATFKKAKGKCLDKRSDAQVQIDIKEKEDAELFRFDENEFDDDLFI